MKSVPICHKRTLKCSVLIDITSFCNNTLSCGRRCRFFSSVLPESHPFNSSPKISPPVYHGETRSVPMKLLHHIQMKNKDHQHELANTLRPYFQSRTPYLLRHLYCNSDAIYYWKSLEYWRVAVGNHTNVEVEVGKTYNISERITMKFGDYLDYLSLCIEQDSNESTDTAAEEVAYLAQNELFPQVMDDIEIPSLCCEPNASYNIGQGKLYHTMLWMGPRNTVSPLHYDPLDNLLIQVTGWKRVLLFPASKTTELQQWHYGGADGNQYNTSAVDIESPDNEKYPNFTLFAPIPFECVLGPGDALYIPKRWWHHVRSLEFSVSTNIWWR